MKLLSILLTIFSISGYAEEECVFDESAYIEFINKYSAENRNSKIEVDGKTLVVSRNTEEIIITGGGCIHLGVAIELGTKQEYTEEQFLQKALNLSIEFGDWLIDTRSLKGAIEKDKFHVIDGAYSIEVDAMTVFSASYDNQGKVSVAFYIN
jgi:hypothetical protein